MIINNHDRDGLGAFVGGRAPPMPDPASEEREEEQGSSRGAQRFKGPAALDPEAQHSDGTVSQSPASCYRVRAGGAWANIYVRDGSAEEHSGVRYWVELAVNSDYGSFGYYWSHIGADWRHFLANLDLHYAMQKMMGERFRIALLVDEAADKARELILDRRRNGMTRADARTLWDAIEDAESADDCRDFLRRWDDQSGGLFYRHELWDSRWDKVNPQAKGFWQDIWPHFMTALGAQDGALEASAQGNSGGTTK